MISFIPRSANIRTSPTLPEILDTLVASAATRSYSSIKSMSAAAARTALRAAFASAEPAFRSPSTV